MGKNYRNVSQSFWTDSKIDDDFTPEEKYFFLYLLTNPHTSVCGCYEISMKQMERETGYNCDTVSRLISRMQDVHKVIRYDDQTKEVLIVNWPKYNWTKSEKLISAVVAAAEHIKSAAFKKYIIDTVSIRYGYSSETSDKDYDYDYDKDYDYDNDKDIISADEPRKPTSETEKSKSFQHPTVEEVRAYCQERGNKVDPERFVTYYDANGWVQGNRGKPIKDWKAAVRYWECREQTDKKNAPTSGSSSGSSIDMDLVDQLMNPQPQRPRYAKTGERIDTASFDLEEFKALKNKFD